MTEPRNRRWTARDWAIFLAAFGAFTVSMSNAWQGKNRDEVIEQQSTTLGTIKHNTNSSLTELKDETKAMRAEITALKVLQATSQERQTPTAADGSAK